MSTEVTALDSPDAPAALAWMPADWPRLGRLRGCARCVRCADCADCAPAQVQDCSGSLRLRRMIVVGTVDQSPRRFVARHPMTSRATALPAHSLGASASLPQAPRGTRRRTGVCACTGVREPIPRQRRGQTPRGRGQSGAAAASSSSHLCHCRRGANELMRPMWRQDKPAAGLRRLRRMHAYDRA